VGCPNSQFDQRNVRTCLGAFPAYSNGLLQKEASYNEAVECIVLLNHAMRRTSTGKALSPTVDRLNCGWMRRLVLAERKARRLGKSATRTNGPRYDGAQPRRTLYVSTAILNWMRCGMRNQCRLISASDTWSERRKPKISRAAAFKTDCRRRDR